MFEIEALKEIRLMKESERQKAWLAEGPDGKRYIKRVLNGDKREIYKALQKIHHANIPKIFYVGFQSDTVVVEEYIEGISLNDLMEQNQKLGRKQVHAIAKQLLSAIDKLHEFEIIHRDIKPDNILIDASNHIWLTDYDIARIFRKEVRRDTETVGTFGYAPIEQYGILPTDFKTDIYAFGATLKALLDAAKVKGFLYKAAQKCQRLDPSERYKSAKAVKRAITLNALKAPIVLAVLVIGITVFLAGALKIEKGVAVNEGAKLPQKTEQQTEAEAPETEGTTVPEAEPPKSHTVSGSPTEQEEKQEEKQEGKQAEPKADEAPTFEGTFYGFSEGAKEAWYKKNSFFSNVCIFSMQQPWEHVLFLEDMTKSGKIKMGKENAVIEAEMTLNNGSLSVSLNDGKGHTYKNQFRFDPSYEYTAHYTEDLRKNADIICYDFDGDGGAELLLGLNEGVIGVAGQQVYNNFNYCMAWCVRYDAEKGFTLCDGEMFSEKHAFWISNAARKLNVEWEDFGDITGYVLNGNQITPVM